jgi:hypothetical protein
VQVVPALVPVVATPEVTVVAVLSVLAVILKGEPSVEYVRLAEASKVADVNRVVVIGTGTIGVGVVITKSVHVVELITGIG